jgi:hypothetical protein
MTFWKSAIGLVVVLALTLVLAACSDVGVGGIGVSYPGARWGGGATGPGVLVGGAGYP